MHRTVAFIIVLCISMTLLSESCVGQNSDKQAARLAQFLKKNPKADTNGDGRLSREEFFDFRNLALAKGRTLDAAAPSLRMKTSVMVTISVIASTFGFPIAARIAEQHDPCFFTSTVAVLSVETNPLLTLLPIWKLDSSLRLATTGL